MSSDSQRQPAETDDWFQTDAEGDIWSGYIWPEHVVDWYEHFNNECTPSALESVEAVGTTEYTSQPTKSGEDTHANQGIVGARRPVTSAISNSSTRDGAGSSGAGSSQDRQNLGLLTLNHDGESMIPRDDWPGPLSPISSEYSASFICSDGVHPQEMALPETPRRRRSDTTRRKIREAALGRIMSPLSGQGGPAPNSLQPGMQRDSEYQ
jgi:hypothetical protein